MPRPHALLATLRPRLAVAVPCARALPRLQGALIAAWAFTPAAG